MTWLEEMLKGMTWGVLGEKKSHTPWQSDYFSGLLPKPKLAN